MKFLSAKRENIKFSKAADRRSCVTLFLVKMTAERIIHQTIDNVPVVESDSESKVLVVCQKKYYSRGSKLC
jgi:hypothetical protein